MHNLLILPFIYIFILFIFLMIFWENKVSPLTLDASMILQSTFKITCCKIYLSTDLKLYSLEWVKNTFYFYLVTKRIIGCTNKKNDFFHLNFITFLDIKRLRVKSFSSEIFLFFYWKKLILMHFLFIYNSKNASNKTFEYNINMTQNIDIFKFN